MFGLGKRINVGKEVLNEKNSIVQHIKLLKAENEAETTYKVAFALELFNEGWTKKKTGYITGFKEERKTAAADLYKGAHNVKARPEVAHLLDQHHSMEELRIHSINAIHNQIKHFEKPTEFLHLSEKELLNLRISGVFELNTKIRTDSAKLESHIHKITTILYRQAEALQNVDYAKFLNEFSAEREEYKRMAPYIQSIQEDAQKGLTQLKDALENNQISGDVEGDAITAIVVLSGLVAATAFSVVALPVTGFSVTLLTGAMEVLAMTGGMGVGGLIAKFGASAKLKNHLQTKIVSAWDNLVSA